MKGVPKIISAGVLTAFFASFCLVSFSQEAIGVSAGFEFLPYAGLLDPDPSISKDTELQMRTWSFGAAYPLSFWNGGTLLINTIGYKRVGFHYWKWEDWKDLREPTQAHLISYSFFIRQYLTDRWYLIMSMGTGLASDFEGDIAIGDFALASLVGVMRSFGEKKNFTLGGGIAPSPIPWGFLYIEWNIGTKLNIKGSLPYELVITYKPIPLLEVALLAALDNVGFHGNPDRFDFKDPNMSYSYAKAGSAIQLNFTQWLHLRIEGGYVFSRSYSLFDGPKEKGSFAIKNAFYLKAGTVIGM